MAAVQRPLHWYDALKVSCCPHQVFLKLVSQHQVLKNITKTEWIRHLLPLYCILMLRARDFLLPQNVENSAFHQQHLSPSRIIVLGGFHHTSVQGILDTLSRDSRVPVQHEIVMDTCRFSNANSELL